MNYSSLRQALIETHKKLRPVQSWSNNQKNVLVGVSGYVASGKTRFCRSLMLDMETLLNRGVIYLPFDFWVNGVAAQSQTYYGRFFMDDFIKVIQCIEESLPFMMPRYDIVKRHGTQKVEDQTVSESLIWNRKGFVRCSMDFQTPRLLGSEGLYVERQSGYVYSFFPAMRGMAFLVDGTLIFPKEVMDYYHCSVFVEASWCLRLARMIRRFNRREIFAPSAQPMQDYVGFLVEEARTCADQEIRLQIRPDMILAQSTPETLSNYLDLVYLGEQVNNPTMTGWVSVEEVDIAKRVFLDYLRAENDPVELDRLRRELSVLIESKHLLTVESRDAVLMELTSVLEI